MANNMECNQKLSFVEAVLICFKKYADFKGRARRSEFWWWTLFAMVINLIALVVACGGIDSSFCSWLIPYLIILLPSMAVTARRLHDIGRTAWWLLGSYGTFIIGLISLPLGMYHILMVEEFAYEIPLPENYQEIVAAVGMLSFMLSMIFFLITFVFALYDSKPQPNKYGASPKYQMEQ